MDRDLFNADTASAAGLIIGIILGSLALDLSGAAARGPAAPQQTGSIAAAVASPPQSAPATAAVAGNGAISQR